MTTLRWIASLLLLSSGPEASGGPVPIKALTEEHYQFVSDPARLPGPIQRALAHALGQKTLHMAAAGKPFNWSDVVDDTLPDHRLILAGVGDRYVVVHFEEGGFSPAWKLSVFTRSGALKATPLCSGQLRESYRDRSTLQVALRSGAFWQHCLIAEVTPGS